MQLSKKQAVLGIDPGYAIVGFGLVSEVGGRLTTSVYGAIQTPAKLPLSERLLMIHRELVALIVKYTPTVVGLERLYFAKNAKTAMDVGQARGVILLTCMQHNLPVYEFTPLQVKQAVCGTGGADKGQVQRMVRTLLGLHETPKPDDVADALAVAIACNNSLAHLTRTTKNT